MGWYERGFSIGIEVHHTTCVTTYLYTCAYKITSPLSNLETKILTVCSLVWVCGLCHIKCPISGLERTNRLNEWMDREMDYSTEELNDRHVTKIFFFRCFKSRPVTVRWEEEEKNYTLAFLNHNPTSGHNFFQINLIKIVQNCLCN